MIADLQIEEHYKNFSLMYYLIAKKSIQRKIIKIFLKINKIFAGKMTQDIIERAKAANFDERLSLLGMLLDGVNESVHEVSIDEKVFKAFFSFLKQKKAAFPVTGAIPAEILNGQIQTNAASIVTGKKAALSLRRIKRSFTASMICCDKRGQIFPSPA